MKNNNRKTNANIFGSVQYDIPVFSIRSAFLIVASAIIVTLISSWAGADTMVIKGVLCLTLALTCATARCFIDTKRGFGRYFVLTFIVMFATCGGVLIFIK